VSKSTLFDSCSAQKFFGRTPNIQEEFSNGLLQQMRESTGTQRGGLYEMRNRYRTNPAATSSAESECFLQKLR